MNPDPAAPDLKAHLDTDTHSDTSPHYKAAAIRSLALTLLCHWSPQRIGERALLDAFDGHHRSPVSRLEPLFGDLSGGEQRPLGDPRLSRRPFLLGRDATGYFIDASQTSIQVEVNGERVTQRRSITEAELEAGVVMLLGERVALCWHWIEATTTPPPGYELVGESASMVNLRNQIQRVSDLDLPVLIRGESGSGKELVAQALAHHGPRLRRPFLSLNLAAVAPNLAASELFGSIRGAFSGADRHRPGIFREADGGTLFLDEVGEASPDVQVLLLRALESGEIQPVGSARPVTVDVRVLAATDADLEAAVVEGRFKEPLLHRLRGFELTLPTLRRRRDDLGRLLIHFLAETLASFDEAYRLAARSPADSAYIPARLVARLALHLWPGNVRELRNAVRQIAIASRGEASLLLDAWAASTAPAPSPVPSSALPPSADSTTLPPPPSTPSSSSASPYRDPSSVTLDELRDALRIHRWNIRRAAHFLSVSRGSVYELIQRFPELRTAADLDRDEIEATVEQYGQDWRAVAEALEVSVQGLKRRLKQLEWR